MQAEDKKLVKRQELLKTNLINFLAILKAWSVEAKKLGHDTKILEEKLNQTANTVSVGGSSMVSSKFIELTREFWTQIDAKEKQPLINLLEKKKGSDPLLCSLSSLLNLKGFITEDKEETFWHNLTGFVKLSRTISSEISTSTSETSLVPVKAV